MDKQLARIFSLFLLAVPCFAQTPNQTQQIQTYYVDAITPGSNSNPGTAASPFATVAHVASVAPTGTARVFVKLPNLAWQQLYMPYLNLAAVWVGQQGASATTLYDVTNAAHNATIANGAWSAVQGIPGLICNGTNTIATYPAFVGNSNFAAYVVSVSPTDSSGVTWNEGNSGEDNTLIWLTGANNNAHVEAYIRDSALHGGFVNLPVPPVSFAGNFNIPHVYSMTRNGTTAGFGLLPDFPSTTPTTLSMASVNITTNEGAICAGLRTSAGPYWAGTLQAIAIYTAFPSAAVANNQYDGLQAFISQALNLRLNLRQYNDNNLTAGPIWVRQGVTTGIGDPVNGPGFAQEPNVIYDPVNSHCTLVTATNGCLRMIYSWLTSIAYAESTDPNGIAWTGLGSSVIAGHRYASFIHVGSTLYVFATNTSGNTLDLYSSADTGTPSFTLVQAGVVPLGSAGQIDSSGIFNTWVEPDGNGGYEMLYECNGSSSWVGSGAYILGAAKSPDLIHWTKIPIPVNNFDLYNPSGTFFKKINGRYWAWMQTGLTSGSDIYRSVSNSLSGVFQRYPNASTFPRGTVGEGLQVADVSMLDLTAVSGWAKTYMWFGVVPTGAALSGQNIKLATTSLTIPQLVQTTEGATTTSP